MLPSFSESGYDRSHVDGPRQSKLGNQTLRGIALGRTPTNDVHWDRGLRESFEEAVSYTPPKKMMSCHIACGKFSLHTDLLYHTIRYCSTMVCCPILYCIVLFCPLYHSSMLSVTPVSFLLYCSCNDIEHARTRRREVLAVFFFCSRSEIRNRTFIGPFLSKRFFPNFRIKKK